MLTEEDMTDKERIVKIVIKATTESRAWGEMNHRSDVKDQPRWQAIGGVAENVIMWDLIDPDVWGGTPIESAAGTVYVWGEDLLEAYKKHPYLVRDAIHMVTQLLPNSHL